MMYYLINHSNLKAGIYESHEQEDLPRSLPRTAIRNPEEAIRTFYGLSKSGKRLIILSLLINSSTGLPLNDTTPFWSIWTISDNQEEAKAFYNALLLKELNNSINESSAWRRLIQ